MSAFQRIARTAVLAAVAVSTLAAAGAASAGVEMTRPECIKGFWHERTYDISNPDKWVLIEDKATDQPCSVPQPPVPGEESSTTPQLNANYRLTPSWDLRSTLHYQVERPQPQPSTQLHISTKYMF